MDEFLDFSATRRGSHRRSISDSIAFLEAHSSGVGSHHFDKVEDEQFMFMFNDDTEVSVLSPRVAFLDHQRLLLNVDNKQRIAALAQDKISKDAHHARSIEEINNQQVYHQQSLKKMEDHISDQSPADIKPSVEKEQLLIALSCVSFIIL
ncbi:hypothetical protein F2Q69_00014831 [Brassica cretica]|uniref:Uncharacterized protein n=1 Tax=Brassica cretica TaxID=69181 RepID=A0A8S9R6B4_BRACR|nr:hypothetical protein F2Q69_00014831 [Brassica cretica]